MIEHLYANFLDDVGEYRLAENFWAYLWGKVPQEDRANYRWTTPWLSTGSPEILDGNPIFSAWSPALRKGLRIIQHEPTGREAEIVAYLDTMGGSVLDPESIKELVISCAPSNLIIEDILSYMCDWIANRPISYDLNGSGVANRPAWAPELVYDDLFEHAA